MKPFHLIAIPHKDILEGKLTMDVFAADLWEVYKGRAVEDYQNPEVFFRKTFLTSGLKNLLQVALKRLKGEGGDSVIQLQTPFGGGKTHSLIALYHAFTNPDSVKPYFNDAFKAKVVVIVGTAISPRKEGDTITGTLWGEIERQLEGKIEKLSQPIAPGREALRELLSKHQPLLILMDEILVYVAKSAGIAVNSKEIKIGETNLANQTIVFIQELTETVKSLEKALLVVTLPSSVMEYPDEEKAELLLSKLQKVAGRVEKIYYPVRGDEIYEVIRRRLFSRVDERYAKEIVNEFLEYYEREGILIEKAEYREKMLKSYPFHPEVIDIFDRRWGSLPKFQRTRGVLRILSLAVHRLKDSSIPLIRPSDFDMSFDELRQELVKFVGTEFESVLRADITENDSNCEKVNKSLGDAYRGMKLATKIASAIFLYSFSGGERGATIGELKLSCADTSIPSSVIVEVVNNLASNLFYLWKEDARYVFKSQANLNKIVVSKMSEIEPHEIEKEALELLQKHMGKAIPTYINPKNSRDVPDTEDFKLVVLLTKDRDKIEEILKSFGEMPRVNRNTIFFLTPKESEKYKFENWIRRKIAWESIKRDKSLNLTESQKKEVEEKIKELGEEERNAIREFYRLLYVPGKDLEEIDLGIPVVGNKKKISDEILDKLKAEGKIVEKIAPILILDRYLSNKDYVELEKLYKSLLSTPGEIRIAKDNFIKSVQNGVKEGFFGFGIVKNGKIENIRFKELPQITLQEYEAIIRKELCETKEKEEIKVVKTEKVSTAEAEKSSKGVHVEPLPVFPVYKGLSITVKLPKGKFSDFYRGVLSFLEEQFEETEVEIKINAKKGKISKSDYEDRVKETLSQIKAEILDESKIE